MSRLQNIYDNLTIQAKLALAAGILVFVSAIMATKTFNMLAIVSMIIVLLSGAFGVYVVDCYSKGQCEILAWVASSALFLNAMITLVYGNQNN